VKFGIVIRHERRQIRLQVERIYQSPETEKYQVTARNTSFTLQTNSPLLRNKGLKYKPADWKVVQGAINNRTILESIIKAIEAKLKEL
jgi:uncharacterized glyoxalase superfamily metalloenzyme YdcJ